MQFQAGAQCLGQVGREWQLDPDLELDQLQLDQSRVGDGEKWR